MPQVIFEFARIGDVVRVSATDEETGLEVIIQGPRQAGKADLQRIALRKLKYVMAKKAGEQQNV